MYNLNIFKWVDKLNDIINFYNNIIYRLIRMNLVFVIFKDEIKIWKLFYENNDDKYFFKLFIIFKYLINDVVWIFFIKKIFEWEYDIWWSIELFIIVDRYVKEGISKYFIKDFNNEIIIGEFYEEEF